MRNPLKAAKRYIYRVAPAGAPCPRCNHRAWTRVTPNRMIRECCRCRWQWVIDADMTWKRRA